MNYFIVEENFVDERLDKFLTFKTTESRSQIKKAIENGLILVNDKPAKVHQFLKFKDKVTIIEKNPKQKLRPKTNSKSQLTKLKNTI